MITQLHQSYLNKLEQWILTGILFENFDFINSRLTSSNLRRFLPRHQL